MVNELYALSIPPHRMSGGAEGQNPESGRVGIGPGFPSSGCVIRGKLLNMAELLSLLVQNRDNNSIYFQGPLRELMIKNGT